MHRIKTLAFVLFLTAAPLALSACNTDTLTGPDQVTQEYHGGNGGHTQPDGDIRD